MTTRSTTPSRHALMGLAVAGALAGSAGPAAAQYYSYDEDITVYRYGYRGDDPRDLGYRDFGYRYRPMPRMPVALPQRAASRIAARDFGLVQIERTLRSGESYIVDGQAANGRRTRLILDAYNGDLIDRIALPPARRTAPEPDIARADPRENEQPARQRLVPRPPERPAALKPPAQASAPATAVPPSPAAPPRAPEPETPAPAEPAPPATASAPATTVPPAPAATPEPAPEATPPEPAPKLVNPEDVRGTEGTDRLPPLAKALSAGGSAPDTGGIPPVQTEDPRPSVPKPETPIAPVTPLE